MLVVLVGLLSVQVLQVVYADAVPYRASVHSSSASVYISLPGYSIARRGNMIAIGAYTSDAGGSEKGAVYLVKSDDGDFSNITMEDVVVIDHRTDGIALQDYTHFGSSVVLGDGVLLVTAKADSVDDYAGTVLYLIQDGGNNWADIVADDVTKVRDDWRYYEVVRVIDGDTIDVRMGGETERVRLIGVDTPETVHPSKPVECFGKEAANYTKDALVGTRVVLGSDASQGDRGAYGRLLRYVFLPDGTNFNEKIIRDGYAYEYTYDTPYAYQGMFRDAEQGARRYKRGLWGAACEKADVPPIQQIANTFKDKDSPSGLGQCVIKGNISTEKIYHVPGCRSYERTEIDKSEGERWFCTEQEAVNAGWRKAKNC